MRIPNSIRQWWYRTWPYRWYETTWTYFYCRHAHYHLMRHKASGAFIVVYDRECDDAPQIDGYAIVVACWTPKGCQKAAENEVWYERFVEAVGRENILAAIQKKN